MLKVIQSPAKYLQGPDAAVLFGQYAKNLAESFFVIADDFVMKLAGEKVVNGLQSHDIRCHAERFNGECSHAEINRLMAILQKQGCRGVVGIGGGKTLDTAKAIGYYQKLPVVVIPTIASTDAPTSALSVIYTEAGEFEEYLIYPKNPDMVVMTRRLSPKRRYACWSPAWAMRSPPGSRPKLATMRAPPAWPEDSPPRRR